MFYQVDNKSETILRSSAALVGDSHALLSLAVETLDKLTSLNLKYAQHAVNHGVQHAHSVLKTEHAHEVIALHAEKIHPTSEAIVTYTVELFEITNDASTKVTALLNANFEEMGQELEQRTFEAAKNLTLAPEVVVAAVKEATEASKLAYARAIDATKQATSLRKTHVKNVSNAGKKTT